MSFRIATAEDAEWFYRWRLRDEAAGALVGYWNGTRTTRAQHKEWFRARLGYGILTVWEHDGKDAGCLRIEPNGETTFQAERHHEPLLLEDLKETAVGKLKFTLDLGDPRADTLEQAGLVESPVRFFTYRP